MSKQALELSLKILIEQDTDEVGYGRFAILTHQQVIMVEQETVGNDGDLGFLIVPL